MFKEALGEPGESELAVASARYPHYIGSDMKSEGSFEPEIDS